jgi:hypothetical protein
LNWIQIPLKKNEMMQIDEKGIEDLLVNMVLQNNNLKNKNLQMTSFHASLLLNDLQFEIVK